MRYLGIDMAKKVSKIGLGTWQFGSREWGYGDAYARSEAKAIVRRAIEQGLLDALERDGGCIAFSPLAQGMLTSRYLDGIPAGSRASRDESLSPSLLSDATVNELRALNEIAQARGQTLAQMALTWILRDQRVTSALIGASSVAQLEENLRAADGPAFSADELAAIDAHSVKAGIASEEA
jgi:L-glyceraldehyde 3-phosphate reductase